MSKGKKRSGARPGSPQPLRGTKGRRSASKITCRGSDVMSKGKKRSGARPGRPQPLRGSKGKSKGARLWFVGVQEFALLGVCSTIAASAKANSPGGPVIKDQSQVSPQRQEGELVL